MFDSHRGQHDVPHLSMELHELLQQVEAFLRRRHGGIHEEALHGAHAVHRHTSKSERQRLLKRVCRHILRNTCILYSSVNYICVSHVNIYIGIQR